MKPPMAPWQGRCAWRSADLSSDESWIYQLSDDERAELDAALREAKRRGATIPHLGKQDFPLPGLSKKLGSFLDDLENGRGVALIRGFDVTRYSRIDAASIFWGIGTYLGRAVAQNAYGEALGHVRDLGKDWTKDMTARGYQTTKLLPFHNDSCDVVGLLCLQAAKVGGKSSVVSSVAVFNELLNTRPDVVETCCQPFHFDRRDEHPPGEAPFYPMPLFNVHHGRMFNRYNRTYAESAQRFPDAPRLTAAQREALDVFDGLCAAPTLRYDMVFQPGDMQFVNNYVVLHSRTDYEDYPEPERKRHLLRLWLLTPGLSDRPDAYDRLFRTYEQWQLNPKPPIFDFENIPSIETH